MARSARRPRRKGGGQAFLICCLFMSLTAAQQQLADRGQPAIRKDDQQSAQDVVSASYSPFEDGLPEIDPNLRYRKKTETITTNDKSIATLAPARINQAVRAPPVNSREPVGPSSLLQARSLQDWEVEDLVLLATLDGVIHATDRKTGIEKWALGIPDSPMIETIHHRQRDGNRSSSDEHLVEDDYMFVVEPSKDGNLYIQHKDPAIGLQRLGITVKSLTDRTPQSFDDPPLVYNGKHDTALYTVDADTGNVLKSFDTGDAFVDNQQQCRRLGNFESIEEEECEPRRTFELGRVQYTVVIRSGLTGERLCTIKFSEWMPNNRDLDLQSQYMETKDKNHIYSLHDGRIIGIDYSENTFGKRKFTRVLSSPVARVFDVVRPAKDMGSTIPLVLLSQPLAPPEALPQSDSFEDRTSRVFVNCTENGDWYAFSELTYPMVTSQAEWAKVLRTPPSTSQDEFYEDESLDPVIAYAGIQNLGSTRDAYTLRTLPGPDPGSAVDMPSPNDLQPQRSVEHSATSKFGGVALLTTFFVLVVGFLTVGGRIWGKDEFRRMTQLVTGQSTEYGETKLNVEPADQGSRLSPPYTVSNELGTKMVQDPMTSIDGVNLNVPNSDQNLTSEPKPETSILVAPSNGDSKEAIGSERLEDIDDDDSGDEDAEDDPNGRGLKEDGNDRNEGNEANGKRKTKRGKRGGKRHKKGKKPEALILDVADAETGPPEVNAEPKAMPAERFVEDVPETPVCEEKQLPNSQLQVGGITVDSANVLGQGSNGTIVYAGKHHGRSVAVKRLMRSVNSLAAREIKILLRSDDNDNVIRYFGQEVSNHFTWIALERFTASLDQVVERPEKYEAILPREGLDQKDCLTQITKGVQHLHGLKLVHRDLKPQNILVKARDNLRLNGRSPQLRYVISDFGLCKQLDENGPGSTFAPTANHTAAGTTGWRAPELLVDCRAPIAAPLAKSGEGPYQTTASIGSTTSTDGATVDLASGRRVTKAIDIFSLGCIFYYVMTSGCHPFDEGGSSLARDYNIKSDRKDLQALRMDNYSFEADDLVRQMIQHDPGDRISTFEILKHPYFWPNDIKLQFLCELSDYFEHEKQAAVASAQAHSSQLAPHQISTPDLDALQSLAPSILGPKLDFLQRLPKRFKDGLGKQRSYTGSRILDLLRALRNKKNHFNDLDPEVKAMIENLPGGYWQFWAERFPSLLVCCHCLVIEHGMLDRRGRDEGSFPKELLKYYE